MDTRALDCRLSERRKKLFGNPDWNGLDFLEVADNQHSLCVHFFGQVPAGIGIANVRIEGGRRIRDIRVLNVEIKRANDVELDDCLHITLDKPGDFSVYRLCLIEAQPRPHIARSDKNCPPGEQGKVTCQPYPGIDPRYACLEFSFKVACSNDLDCQPADSCPAEPAPEPEINYLAKDFASFRQLMFDRLALILPDWQERHLPDIGVTLVELLAYVGDHLSYYQDAVASEAYLDTARQRISVRRHARLVDYRLHEGCNARAWITVQTRTDLPPLKAKDFYFITGCAELATGDCNLVRAEDIERLSESAYEVFEPLIHDPDGQVTFRAAHSEIFFYTWGDNECCLPKGTTRATLLDAWKDGADGNKMSPSVDNIMEDAGVATAAEAQAPHQGQRELDLKCGDVLIFEEKLGPTTGNPADADPAHRHAVRLTKVTQATDDLYDRQPVIEIEWAAEDALPFALCLSVRLAAPDCGWLEQVSVARGNVVLVDHGRRCTETLDPVATLETPAECACEGSVINGTAVPERFRPPPLKSAPLTFAEPLATNLAASLAFIQDARQALPSLRLTEYLVVQDPGSASAEGPTWMPQYDLLASQADDAHFVVEIDDEGRGHLRFGDGELGLQPIAGTRFQATYRTGSGPAGNVGCDTISCMVLRQGTLSGVSIKPRNPLPALGGREPEATAEAKLFAPQEFRNRRMRAISAADYAELAQQNTKLQRAACALRWTGSWYEAQLAVDPIHTEVAAAALLAEMKRFLFRYRRMGHDLAVTSARYIPLKLVLEVCVLPHFTRGQVKAELLKVFGNRALADGRLGFFHPDNLSFGDGIYHSRIIAAAKAVEGVETVRISSLQRLDFPLDAPGESHTPSDISTNGDLSSGVLPLGAMEIAQLDNDPGLPENGTLVLLMGGGR